MGWTNPIRRRCSSLVVFVAGFALVACGDGGRDPAEVSAEPGPRDPSVAEFLDKTLPDRIVWHDGGNGWSLGIVARFVDRDAMVFWVSNQAYKDGEWNLEEQEQDLTLGIAERVLEDA